MPNSPGLPEIVTTTLRNRMAAKRGVVRNNKALKPVAPKPKRKGK